MVHDFDAHSWVEVYFRGIGWVTFDPTPGAAPPSARRLGGDVDTAFRRPGPNRVRPASRPEGPPRRRDQRGVGAAEQGISAGGIVGLVLLAMLVVGAAVATRRLAPARRARPTAIGRRAGRGAPQRPATGRLAPGPGTTLLEIERRADGSRRKPVREYAAGCARPSLRPDSDATTGAERAARDAQGAAPATALAGRVRALLAIPPGGPAAA